MSKVARRLLGKPNEGSDLLRVVFTPVNKLPRDKAPTRKVSKEREWLPSVASAVRLSGYHIPLRSDKRSRNRQLKRRPIRSSPTTVAKDLPSKSQARLH